MRVKDIMGNNRNVKIEELQLHFEEVRGLTFWKNNLRLVLTDKQKEMVKSNNKEVEYFNGYNSKYVKLQDIV